MARTRRLFTPENRVEAAHLVIDSGRTGRNSGRPTVMTPARLAETRRMRDTGQPWFTVRPLWV